MVFPAVGANTDFDFFATMTTSQALTHNKSKVFRLASLILEEARKTYELDDSASASRMPAMEGLRGLAVLLVFGVHFHALFGQHLPANSVTFGFSSFWECIGHSGVDLFFLMSGYLIFGAVIGKTTSLLKFMRRRVQRIYPTFITVFAVYLILSAVFPAENKIPADVWGAQRFILENLLLLPGIFDIAPIITVAWSLSYEIFFYLFLPLLIALLGIRSWKAKFRPVFFAVIAVAYLGFCFLGFYPRPRLVMFLAGILLYDLFRSVPIRQSIMRFVDFGGLTALVTTFGVIYFISLSPSLLRSLPRFDEYSWTYRELVLYIGFFVFVFCCLKATGILRNIFSWTPLRWLGNMSYSYYLIHGLTLKAAALFAGIFVVNMKDTTLGFWVALPVCLLLSMVTSTILFVLVEKRFSLSKSKTASKPDYLNVSSPGVEVAQ
jgi:peptidoglycan/LPS O-acetylase OafA/YrhL